MREQDRMLKDRYRLDAILGEGGMGQVWKGYDTILQRAVAIKEVALPSNKTSVDTAGFYRRVIREARHAATAGRYEDVVTVFDVVEEGGRPWIVMDLLTEPTLQEHVERQGPWAPADLAKTAGRLLAVVSAVHRHGIVHRDLKPANLMVRSDGSLVVLDFGIARSTDDTVTVDGLLVGTPAFMAPEYLQKAQFGPAADAWSLGVVLYYMLTGRSPFERDTAAETIGAVMYGDYPPLAGTEPIHGVIKGLLLKDPAQRLQLDDAAAQLGVTETVVLPPVRQKKKPRRRTWKVAAVSVAAVAGLVGATVMLPPGSTKNPDEQPTSSVVAATTTSSSEGSVSVSPTVSPSPSPSAQAVGNVFTSDTMRVEAPEGWSIDAQGKPPYASLSKAGEGDMQVTRLNGSSLASIVQEQRQNLTVSESPSDVRYLQASVAVWTHIVPRFRCWDFPCGRILVWTAVVEIGGKYAAVVYTKPAGTRDVHTDSLDTQAVATIRAAIDGIELF